MNAVEIEEAISALAEQPFDAAEFPYLFLQAFGNKDTTIKRLRSGASNKSDLGGVLQTNNIHIAVAAPCAVGKTLAEIHMAIAKGLKPWKIALLYSARNAILPNVTGFAISLGGIMGGVVFIEGIFNYPGLGKLLFQAGNFQLRLEHVLLETFANCVTVSGNLFEAAEQITVLPRQFDSLVDGEPFVVRDL